MSGWFGLSCAAQFLAFSCCAVAQVDVIAATTRYGVLGALGVLLALNWWVVKRLVGNLTSHAERQTRLLALLIQVLSDRPCVVDDPRIKRVLKEVADGDDSADRNADRNP